MCVGSAKDLCERMAAKKAGLWEEDKERKQNRDHDGHVPHSVEALEADVKRHGHHVQRKFETSHERQKPVRVKFSIAYPGWIS